jgi:hypothetical protein
LKVLSSICEKMKETVSLESLFPGVVQYCNHHSWHTKNPSKFTEKDGLLTLQMLVYNFMVNVSDRNGDEITELIPFWNALLANINTWRDAIHGFGGVILGNQSDEVSLS